MEKPLKDWFLLTFLPTNMGEEPFILNYLECNINVLINIELYYQCEYEREMKMKLSEKLATQLTLQNIHALKELTKGDSLEVQKAYAAGYIDRDIAELMKEDGKLQELICKITEHTRTDEEQNSVMDGLYQLVDVCYKAGFECGRDLS